MPSHVSNTQRLTVHIERAMMDSNVLIIRDIWDLGREGGHTMYRSVRIKGLSTVVQF